MLEYEISEWNSVIPKDKTFPMPMIYVKEDSELLGFMKENNNEIYLNVTGSGIYDFQKPLRAVGSNSILFPNYRPNFYNKTGYYILVLLTPWLGYPQTKGKITLKKDVPEQIFEVPIPIYSEWYNSDRTDEPPLKNKKKSKTIFLILFLLLLLIILLFLLLKKRN